MSHFDDFFKANYLKIVNHCEGHGFTRGDAEEAVSSAILNNYDAYRAKITGPSPDRALRSWLTRAAVQYLIQNLRKHENSRRGALPEGHDVMHYETPESLLDLKQRMPDDVPDILINIRDKTESRRLGTPNTDAELHRFYRARKTFLSALQGTPPQ